MFITYFYDLQLRMKCSNSTTNHTKRSRKSSKVFITFCSFTSSFP